MNVYLPARLADARKHAFVGKLAETDSANVKIAHKCVATTATEAAIFSPSSELGLLLASCYD